MTQSGKRWIIWLMILCLLAVYGCSGSSEPTDAEEEVEQAAEESEAEEQPEETCLTPEGMAASPLTGEWIPEEHARIRPVAMQINNSMVAYPQSGISQAEVVYETLAEGSITRLMAVFHLYDAGKIGPIRSARHYYLDMASNHDALYMHYGGSPQAYTYINQIKAPSLDGITKPDGVLSWRDPERRAVPRMLEHSVYTSHALIDEAWEAAGYRREVRDDFETGLRFKDAFSPPMGQRADHVVVPFSNAYTSTFVYDPQVQKYDKWQNDEPHMDELSNSQLAFTNLLIQRTEMYVIPGDDAGRREVKVIGRGEGTYVSGGRAISIEWAKENYASPTQYVEKRTGNPLQINQGKTYIAIAPENLNLKLTSSTGQSGAITY